MSIADCAKQLTEFVWDKLKTAQQNTIVNCNGRKKDSHEACKRGSFVYLLFDKNDELLYVGETGTSIKSRLIGDGSGSHRKKPWFDDVEIVKYYCVPADCENSNEMQRKLIEQALSICLKPKYYGRKSTANS